MTPEPLSEDGFTPMFKGTSIAGWRPVPRIYSTVYLGGPHIDQILKDLNVTTPPNPEQHPAHWYIDNEGVLIGEQSKETYGGYLVSEKAYGEFELRFDAKPDWPADTGVIIRRNKNSMEGIQILIDHRKSGNIGGFFGMCIASFHGLHFTLDVERDAEGNAVGLKLEDPETSNEPITEAKKGLLNYACEPKDFIKAWKWADWNSFRIRCVGGALPVITTWVNGLKIAELDVGSISWPNFDSERVAEVLGTAGHIALEVHDNDSMFKNDRWQPGAQCRWRNVRIKDLSKSSL